MHPRANHPDSCCETCAAFDVANTACRRRSPHAVIDQEGAPLGVWPSVSVDDWCFDWLPADTLGQAQLVEDKLPPKHDLNKFPDDQPAAAGAPGTPEPKKETT